AAGWHGHLVGELEELVASHPLRERLAGQLMLALYREGRAGEALVVYREVRDRLATQLGLDPGPGLKSLETAILRDDPAIAAPPEHVPADSVPGIRVVLVDDHPMFRRGMRIALETDPDITVVAEAGDAAEAIRATARTAPDVVVMDLHLPDLSGLDATRLLREAHPALPVLVMTMSGTDDHIVDALRAGARGYILKSAGRDEVLGAIRGVVQGSAVFSADIATRLTALAAGFDGAVNRL
ncbi:response regulator, partial [Actinophytocola sp.]|uniref:response regulator n=1 Tax=Actinophytocola sp. TaxID=1872138 RepID=UPI003899B295